MTITTPSQVQIITESPTQTSTNTCNNSDKVNEITNLTHTSKSALAESENNQEHYNSDSSHSILNSFSVSK